MRHCLTIVLNGFTHDSRVLRECGTLRRAGYRVDVFALHEPGLAVREQHADYTLRRFRLTSRGLPRQPIVQLLKYGESILRMAVAGWRLRPQVVHAHDLPALPIGFVVARLSGAKLIYDSHELWADSMHRVRMPGWMSRLWDTVERWLARRSDATITVADRIAEHMVQAWDIRKPFVVRNVPQRSAGVANGAERPGLRRALGIPADVPVVLYQGNIADDYGVMTLVDAMPHVASPAVLVFLGGGPSVGTLQARAASTGVDHRVFFHPPVPPGEVLAFTSEATIGVSPIRDLCLSYRYALPNKLFEYLQAGLPVVVSDLPEMAALVERYCVGETFPEGRPDVLAARINGLLEPARLEACQRNVRAVAPELTWEREEARLLEAYAAAFGV